MTTGLREAAQALAEEMETDVAAYRFQAAKGDPPPSRALLDEIEDFAARLRTALAAPEPDRFREGAEAMREAAARCADRSSVANKIRALPVPPAPTPEAKPAESAIGWVSEGALLRLQRRDGGIGVTPIPANLSDGDVRVRITVDPAPVEPEETTRGG